MESGKKNPCKKGPIIQVTVVEDPDTKEVICVRVKLSSVIRSIWLPLLIVITSVIILKIFEYDMFRLNYSNNLKHLIGIFSSALPISLAIPPIMVVVIKKLRITKLSGKSSTSTRSSVKLNTKISLEGKSKTGTRSDANLRT